jgi:protein involved in polysaccharide export with SLBB domain
MKFLRRLIALAPLVMACGCATSPPAFYGPSTPYAATVSRTPIAFAPWTEDDYRYRLGAGDELAVRFLLNPDMNTPILIGPDGRGVFPLVGPVRIAGLTVNQADYALTSAYGRVLRNPQVETLVTAYGAAQIYVGGEVKEPGVKTIKGQISITQAVMQAGGFAETAKTGKVAVLRQGPDDPVPHLRVVDVREALKGGPHSGDFQLRPGDVVFVPRSAIAEVDLFVKQYLTSLIPFGFSYGISSNPHF